MKIINIEQLDGYKIIVLTGRYEYVRAVAKHMKVLLYHCPRSEEYFKDYPDIADKLCEYLQNEKDIVAVTTQNAEFLDALLESSMEFVLATVRKFEHDPSDTYRLRVMDKDEALLCRKEMNFELRA